MIAVIINSSSGVEDQANPEARIREAFAAKGVESQVFVANSGDEVVDLARSAVAETAEVIVAAGGDGTINSVAAAVVDSPKPLGILPFGTMNHFAKDLNIPLDLAGAVETIANGHTVNIDIGEVNGRIFVNNSSLGLYPSIIRKRDQQQRLGSGKWPAYIWAAVSSCVAFRFWMFA